MEDFKDLYIRWDGNNKYTVGKIEEDDIISVIVQKLEMILFTNQNEILGQDSIGLGCDLEYWLWKTKVPVEVLKRTITVQIIQYIPELTQIGYSMDIRIYEGTYRDMMEINITINGYNIEFLFK
jgi:hypothetical protein